MRNARIALVALIAVVALITLFVRVPLPSRGYLNIGDVAVVFAGLVLGDILRDEGRLLGTAYGAAAGGIGSALADIVGGYAMFAPITLVAKGLEGACAGFAAGRDELVMHYLWLIVGGALMVATYFLAEWAMPSIGLQGALSEIPANLIQALSGVVGGRLTYVAYRRLMVGTEA